MAKSVITLMVLLTLVAIATARQAKYDKECFRKCCAKCFGRFRLTCVILCEQKCKRSLPISESSDSCISSCVKSTATNFSSDVAKAERCLGSCAERGKKKT
ncbi:hypothetical protein WN944_022150 [Citrus x changshan-huyou]|uniref:Thionin-like protein n=1 Tax=Citrus x changshan-huyou TaxID=2935761 RepID=A0AAP0N2I8_9ROSI